MNKEADSLIKKLEKILKEEKMEDKVKKEFKEFIQKIKPYLNKENNNVHSN